MRSPKKYIWIGVGIVALVGAFLYLSRDTVAPLPNTTTIKRGDIIQEVSVTGRVKPSSTVDLGFERAGRVSTVNARIGQHVEAGAILAEVESSSARGSLQQAEARLAELKRGSRPEELDVKKAQLAKNTQDLENAYLGIDDIRSDAFTKADDALHSKTTGIFSGNQNSSYKYTFSICDSQLTNDGEWGRYTSEDDFSAWRVENMSSSASLSKAAQLDNLTKASAHLSSLSSFLDTVSRSLSLDCTISNSALDTYRTNINTARTNINTAISSINTKKQAIATLALTVAQTKDELSLLQAGTAEEIISAQEGLVLSAQGEIAKYRITAPISGIITKADIKAGEGASVGAIVFSIISDASYKIEAYVPEADIAKIKIKDIARVTLDAYGSDVIFEARVSEIDPAETIIDNVPTYKTTLHFTKNDARIKSGMTANTDIETASRTDALYAPGRSIITRNGEKYIRVVNVDNTTVDTLVTVGLKASNGTIEILGGVTEGTTIVTTPTE